MSLAVTGKIDRMIAQRQKAFSQLQILVCDDDDLMVRIIEQILSQMGFGHVQTTTNPRTALQLLKEPAEKPFDMFICDWVMPEMSGLEVLRHVREREIDVAFIMLTGKTSTQAVTEAAEEGIDAYIAKPFDADQVERKISAVARRVLSRL